MDDAARPGTAPERMMRERDQRTSEAVRREQSRLLSFIRQRVPDPIDAEDILQDVFVELAEAVDELPEEQRAVFIAHELDGKSFKEMAAESGVGINTLLSRKRYAVLHLRERLKDLHDELERG